LTNEDQNEGRYLRGGEKKGRIVIHSIKLLSRLQLRPADGALAFSSNLGLLRYLFSADTTLWHGLRRFTQRFGEIKRSHFLNYDNLPLLFYIVISGSLLKLTHFL
jgi:hypothetical protein